MIKLELNSTDELALRHMGNALTAMAVELNGEVPSAKELSDAEQYGKAWEQSEEALRLREVVENEPNVTSGPVIIEPESLLRELAENEPVDVEPTNDKLDSNGLPWDGRIHSSSKAKIKDGSWKKRKGVDAETLATVEAELTALMAIPVMSAPSNDEMKQAEQAINNPSKDEETSYPLYWRHDGSEEVGIIRDDEEYEQIFSTKSEIIDLISEEMFNELRLKNNADVEYTDESTPPAPEPIVPKPQDATPPPPPVVDAPVGTTPDDVEAVSFVEITRFITGTMVKEMGYTIPEVNNILTAEYGVTFSTLKANEALFPQVLAFLKGQPKK